MNSLMDVIKRENYEPFPEAVALDNGEVNLETITFFVNTKPIVMPPEGSKLLSPYIQDFSKAMHIPIIEVKGYEADDLIGTIAKQAEK
jgi:DNA polymerase-1